MQIDLKKDGVKIIHVILSLTGAGLFSFNLLAFKSARGFGSIWYDDTNQTWAMIGVLLIMVGYYVKNWKKL